MQYGFIEGVFVPDRISDKKLTVHWFSSIVLMQLYVWSLLNEGYGNTLVNNSSSGERTACIVCSSSSFSDLWSDSMQIGSEPYNYSFRRCDQCGLHSMYPLPSAEILNSFYDGMAENNEYIPYLYHSDAAEKYSKTKMIVAYMRFREDGTSPLQLASQWLAKGVEWLSGRSVTYTLSIPLQYPNNAAILDIGCGSGDWLLGMKERGYTSLVGQDIVAAGLERLERVGIHTILGDLSSAQLPDSSFDLIKMDHVLEHLPDPMAHLREIERLLKPGGRFVITVPAIESVSFRLAQRLWNPLQPLCHLHHFSRESLTIMGRENGLHLARHRFIPVYNEIIESLKGKMPKSVYMILVNRFVRVISQPLYSFTMKLVNSGDYLTVEFIKPAVS